MSNITQIKDQLQELQNKVYKFQGEERRARMHEIMMLCDQLIQLEEDPFFSYDTKASIHHQLKEYSQAEACYLKMLELHPNNVAALWLLSQVYFDSKQYAKALASLDECINHEISSDFRYELRSKINLALGNIDESKADQKIYDDYQAREQAKWDDPDHYYNYK